MKSYLSETIRTYNATVRQYRKKTESLLPRDELDKFRQLAKKGGLVLDAGCGYGRDCKYLSFWGFMCIGADLSQGMLSAARRYDQKSRFVRSDLRNLCFRDGVFDAIWACASLLHLKKKDARIALREMHRVLRKGGICYFGLKEGKGEAQAVSKTLCGKKRFFSLYSLDEAKSIIELAGFKVVFISIKSLSVHSRLQSGQLTSERAINLFAVKR